MRDLEERDPLLFRDLGVPRSTAASWIRRGPRPVVSAAVLALDQQELQAEILSLQRRVGFLLGIIRARHPTRCISDVASKCPRTSQPRMREPVMLA